MKLLVLLLPCLLGFSNALGQKLTCNCEAVVEYKHRYAVPIFDKPSGKIMHQVKHNLKEEDFLAMNIDREQSGFFHGRIFYAIAGKSYCGWVRKSAWLGTYARAYGKEKLALYRAPALSAPASAHVPGPVPGLLPIRHCAGGWIYVQLIYRGRTYEGWLPPAMQCANSYTTCN
ncbi:hypothetical protein [Hymenobacter cheonanensis]|uniref:hypothetical protein n=1 Tax=Hymenobacter sp. CA2-7 TaxID=3063993 RepID=UPI00272D4FA7|nr:hypothetical protein [Hymenobacter sp. CA2-7]